MQQIEIVHPPKDNEPFLVINKPAGLPSAPLSPDDKKTHSPFPPRFFLSCLKSAAEKKLNTDSCTVLTRRLAGCSLLPPLRNVMLFFRSSRKTIFFKKHIQQNVPFSLKILKNCQVFRKKQPECRLLKQILTRR